jgi:hypothetical protein
LAKVSIPYKRHCLQVHFPFFKETAVPGQQLIFDAGWNEPWRNFYRHPSFAVGKGVFGIKRVKRENTSKNYIFELTRDLFLLSCLYPSPRYSISNQEILYSPHSPWLDFLYNKIVLIPMPVALVIAIFQSKLTVNEGARCEATLLSGGSHGL